MRWCVWRWTYVDQRGQPYLTRLHLLQTPWFSIMIHRIHAADVAHDPHDHPVSFLSIIMQGGYVELRNGRYFCRDLFNYVPAAAQHRIVYVRPNTWTLCFAGPVVQQWGYWRDGAKIPWREYDA